MLKEFREFISRGNVLDLAVGVIIGAAFGKIEEKLRLPMVPVSEPTRAAVRSAMVHAGLIN